jgi:hypothetical protein
MGILGMIVGLVVLRHPLYATVLVGNLVIIILAVDGFIMGILGLVRAFMGAGWGTCILGGLSIILSIFVFANV